MFFVIWTLVGVAIFLLFRESMQGATTKARFFKRDVSRIQKCLILGDLPKASALLEKYTCHDHKSLWLAQAKLLRAQKKYQSALRFLFEASKRYPEELLFRLEEALVYLDLDQADKAMEAFKVCEPILYADAHRLALAQAYLKTNQDEAFLEVIEPYLIRQDNETAFILSGHYFFQKRVYEQAIKAYLQAIELGAQQQYVWIALGYSYVHTYSFEKAEQTFKHILQRDESDVEAVLGLGLCLEKRGMFYKALHLYQRDCIWSQNDPRVLRQAGICALQLRKYLHAHLYFKQAVQRQDNDPELFSYLALSLEHLQKWKEAEEIYLILTEKFHMHVSGYRALAWLFGCGLSENITTEQGLAYAYKALELNQHPVLWEILSACHARAGNYEQALKIQEYLLEHHGDPADHRRRMESMRTLRQHLPLSNALIARSEVA